MLNGVCGLCFFHQNIKLQAHTRLKRAQDQRSRREAARKNFWSFSANFLIFLYLVIFLYPLNIPTRNINPDSGLIRSTLPEGLRVIIPKQRETPRNSGLFSSLAQVMKSLKIHVQAHNMHLIMSVMFPYALC